ncbi:S8 family serine peptidase [Streptomyces sp. NPDC005574]|uniref:S8 family serine peptidase n=1 Tax=Streptomyces sp. NPDC005574 TaxID=3156891 RepID=UPI0033A52B77
MRLLRHLRLRSHLPRNTRALALSLSIGTLLPFAGAPAAVAADTKPLRLPVMPARLGAGAACTGSSDQRATTVPWEQQRLQLTRAWEFSSGAGTTVAVVDTGVSATAPALKGRVTAVGEAGADCVGHGSFVAGLVAAAGADGVRFAGVAQRARIVAVRGTDDRGAATAASVAAGITAATGAGAGVIVVSPALETGSAGLTTAVKDAVAHDAVVVAAAVPDAPTGTGADRATPVPRDYWPAAQPGVLSVLDVDADGGRPDGALLPRRADLTAPGDGVIGIGPRGTGHFIGSGASFAAAFVAGAAAQVRSAQPKLTAEQTVERLVSTAYPDTVPLVDPYAAVTAVTAASAPRRPQARQAPVSLPADASTRPTQRAVLLAAAGGLVVLLVAWAALITPRGRARHWRPAGREPAPERGGA